MPSMAQQIKNALAKSIFKHPYRIPDEVKSVIGTRHTLVELFRQKPALNAVLDTTGASSSAALIAYTIANKDFEVLGTNMTTALCTFNTGGGITLTTAGADADQAILTPHLDTNQSQWQTTLWPSTKSLTFETEIVTGASIAKTIIWAGFKLTNTDAIATDDDQVYFRYSSADSSGAWQIITSRAGTDTTTAVPTGTVAAPVVSTSYRLRMALNAARQPRLWINDKEILYNGLGSVFPALTTAINFIPYIGVAANGATPGAKAISVRGLAVSRLF